MISDADRIALTFGGPGARTFAAFANAVAPIEEDDGGGPAIAAAIYGDGTPANGATDQQMAEARRDAEEWLRGLV